MKRPDFAKKGLILVTLRFSDSFFRNYAPRQNEGEGEAAAAAVSMKAKVSKVSTDRQTDRSFYYRHHLTSFECGRHREALTHITLITPNRERPTFPKGKGPSRRCANRPNAIQGGRASFRHTKVRGVQRVRSRPSTDDGAKLAIYTLREVPFPSVGRRTPNAVEGQGGKGIVGSRRCGSRKL